MQIFDGNDFDVIERAREGDQHAFAHLYRAHSRRVIRPLRARLLLEPA